MNADLINCLSHAADSSENVPHLRRLIVALAINGKLDVCSDAESFLRIGERLKAERVQLIKMGKLKRHEELPPVSPEELPVDVSDACHFERLGNFATLAKGQTGIQSAIPGPFPLVVTAEERSSCDHFDFDGAAAIVPMVSSAGHGKASIKRLHYQEGKFALGNILCGVFPISDEIISARFLYEYLTAFKEELLVTRMIGTANVSLTIGKIAEVPVPLISRALQQRVDELMTLCDRLEAVQEERESLRNRLTTSSLNRLNNGADHNLFRKYARFYFNHLPHLTTRHEHIQELRQTILNLAVRGKLVPQDIQDQPASVLLKRIQAEKEHLARKGAIKIQKLRPLRGIEVEYGLPSTWTWASLGDVITRMDSGWSPECETNPRASKTDWGILKTTAVQKLRFDDRQHKKLPLKLRPRPEHETKDGDILITRAGPKSRVGICCLVEAVEERLMISDKIIRFHLFSALDPRFMALALNAGYSLQMIEDSKSGMAVMQMNISQEKLKAVLIPIAPLAEQHRIVAKVDELMSLCDQLEAQLTTTQTESRRLLEALMHEALTPALEKTA